MYGEIQPPRTSANCRTWILHPDLGGLLILGFQCKTGGFAQEPAVNCTEGHCRTAKLYEICSEML